MVSARREPWLHANGNGRGQIVQGGEGERRGESERRLKFSVLKQHRTLANFYLAFRRPRQGPHVQLELEMCLKTAQNARQFFVGVFRGSFNDRMAQVI